MSSTDPSILYGLFCLTILLICFIAYKVWDHLNSFGSRAPCKKVGTYWFDDGTRILALKARQGTTPLCMHAFTRDLNLQILDVNDCLRAKNQQVGIKNWEFVITRTEQGDYEHLSICSQRSVTRGSTVPIHPNDDIENAIILVRDTVPARHTIGSTASKAAA